jgi:hypothetical protein
VSCDGPTLRITFEGVDSALNLLEARVAGLRATKIVPETVRDYFEVTDELACVIEDAWHGRVVEKTHHRLDECVVTHLCDSLSKEFLSDSSGREIHLD